MPKFLVRKISGPVFKQRMQVKSFTTAENMHKFLNKQDNSWQVLMTSGNPHRSGVYAFVGGKWVNVNTLDPITLAHI